MIPPAARPPAPFGRRLQEAMREYGPLCVGIDPHGKLLAQWGLPQSAAGVREFGLRCVEAFAATVALVKPQSAFFERFGSAGVAALESVLGALREAGTLSLLDVKRGDIGSTMQAYAQAYLADDAPLRADAVTLNPYLGYESLRPALELAADTGRGAFVLALTSNPHGPQVQHAIADNLSVAGRVVRAVAQDNASARRAGELGSVGMIIGATVDEAVRRLGLDLPGSAAPILAPGYGAQGGTPQRLRETFGPAIGQVLPSTSREVLQAGPDARALREAARRAADDLGSAGLAARQAGVRSRQGGGAGGSLR